MIQQTAVLWTQYLLLFTLTLQLVELANITASKNFLAIWSYGNLYEDLESGVLLPRSWIKKIFHEQALTKILFVYLLVLVVCIFLPNVYLFLTIFFFQLFICVRFRGTFNGGSDMMTFVLISGVILMSIFGDRIGLIYISVHTIYSYFKAGIAKAKHREWWNGTALPTFLHRSLYIHSHRIADWLDHNKNVGRAIGISAVAFELSAVALLFFPSFVWFYFSGAVLFHLVIYFTFGLNRFFWAWIGAWPATIFSISALGGK